MTGNAAVERKMGEEPVGKSGGSMQRIRGGYRHEFGSLREFIDRHEGEIGPEVFHLALHLIATHHGRGRPHFPKGGFDPDAQSRSPDIATDVICRFATLQRKFGYWQLAWLENLLRCAMRWHRLRMKREVPSDKPNAHYHNPRRVD